MKLNRRAVLIGGGLLGGGLLVGVAGVTTAVALHDRLALQQALAQGQLLSLWLAIHPDGRIELLSPHTEMGQGANNALVQIVADELDARWDQVHLGQAPADPAFANSAVMKGFIHSGIFDDAPLSAPVDHLFTNAMHLATDYAQLQITGGSASIRFTGWRSMRRGAALARHQLVAAAAARWGVEASTLRTVEGTVVSPTGQTLSYGQLAEAASRLAVPADVSPKPREQWRYIGRPVPRDDLPDKVFGRAIYGIDREVEDMVHAAVRDVAVLGGQVTAVTNEAEVLARRGVSSVLVLPGAVAVVADNPWRAEQAVRAVQTDETAPEPAASATTASLRAEQLAALETGPFEVVDEQGDVAAALASGEVIEATYEVPFLAHATLEPMNATVWARDGQVHVACGVQNPLSARALCAQVLGIPLGAVVFHSHTMGGGFGRRGGGLYEGPMNYLEQAVRIWDQHRKPVKMTWSREQDMRAGRFRNAAVGRYRATLGEDGLPRAWEGRSYGQVVAPSELLSLYGVPNRRTEHVDARQLVPYASWRSVDASIYGFFLESFVDELAAAAGADPLEYRLALLDNDEGRPARTEHARRMANALRQVAELASWRPGVDEDGRAMGIGAVHSFGSYVAQIASVSIEEGQLRVHDVWAAVDCGVAVNPDSVEAQLQGGIVFGLTAARHGRVDIDGGGVVQSNLHDYRLLRMADTPQLHVHIVPSEADPGGAGEVGVPPIAPAVANAVAVLRERPRALPLG
ncbi:MAG: molybdopterin-dependent oxidoreductase [Myxococcales bacterium]|nr:molybdopterin-dependent oxidoreductase [Myxococcales bacterium]